LGFPSYFNESAARARTHSKAQVKQLAAAIERYGFNVPIVIDETNRILAGHGRLAAARQLGMEAAPCIRIGAMSEADKKAYVIADNRIAEKAGWNRTLLAEELSFLVGESFEIELTGFSVHEVDVILADAEAAKPEGSDPEADAAPEVSPGPPVTRRGDVWALGRHRLICGDARAPDDYVDLMQGDVAARWRQSVGESARIYQLGSMPNLPLQPSYGARICADWSQLCHPERSVCSFFSSLLKRQAAIDYERVPGNVGR